MTYAGFYKMYFIGRFANVEFFQVRSVNLKMDVSGGAYRARICFSNPLVFGKDIAAPGRIYSFY